MTRPTCVLRRIATGTGLRHTVVYLLVCECDQCGRLNTHGGGDNIDGIAGMLGDRCPHCRCPNNYEITDPDNIIAAYTRRAS